jgi:hypothetical protein
MRAMSIGALCLHINVAHRTWNEWKQEGGDHFRSDLSPVITRAEAIIYKQKFEGASADLLNANIIARDLGLKEKVENDLKSSDGTMSPKAGLDVSGMPTEVLLAIKAAKDAAEQG